MPKIVNQRYREFLEKGVIELFSMDELDKGLIKAGRSKFGKQARAFLIALYYCGARPVELLQLKPMNIEKKKNYLTIQIPTAKRGVPRVISLPFARKHVTELYKYSASLFDDVYIFYDLISYKTRYYDTKKGIKKQYVIITDRVYYYIKKWLGVNPYFLRHSRLSSLAQNDASMNELRQFKGAKSFDSVYPYMHMSSKMSQNIGRKLK
jgi:integrase